MTTIPQSTPPRQPGRGLFSKPVDPLKGDYSDLRSDQLADLRWKTKQIRTLDKRQIDDTVEKGRLLIAVKELLGYGRFGTWLKTEFEASIDTAENAIHLSQFITENPNRFGNFGISVLYQLAAPSASSEFIEAVVIAQDEKGTPLTNQEVRAIKKSQNAAAARLNAAIRTASENSPITTILNSAAELIETANANGGHVETEGESVAADAAITETAYEAMQRQREHINGNSKAKWLHSGVGVIRGSTIDMGSQPETLGDGQIVRYVVYENLTHETV